MIENRQLLQQYAEDRSEAAFTEIVRRHIDLVYSAALRMVGGDSYLARDVTQIVFIDLARQAPSLRQVEVLEGWLHRHACFTAAKAVRTEQRRRAREQIALEMRALENNTEPPWALIAPHLDDCLNQLSGQDRDAIVLRFLKQQDLRAVGEALGVGDDAAQKRVSRALEKLREILSRRGVPVTAVMLASLLAAESIFAAPVGLSGAVTTASIAAAKETGTALTFLKFMASTKLKAGIVSAAIVASLVAPMMVQYQAQARLREQDVALQEGADQVSRLQEGNQRLSNQVAKGKGLQPLPNDQFMGLLRLRSEVALLRTKVQEMSQPKTTPTASAKDVWAAKEQLFAARVDMLKQWMENNPSEKIPEIELLTTRDWLHAIDGYTFETTDEYSRAMRLLRINAEMQVMDRIDVFGAFKRYAHDNNGLQPTDLAQLKPYFASSVDDAILQRYEIVPATSLVKELQGNNEWVITQKAPTNEALDSRFAYGQNSGLNADERVTNRWTRVR